MWQFLESPISVLLQGLVKGSAFAMLLIDLKSLAKPLFSEKQRVLRSSLTS